MTKKLLIPGPTVLSKAKALQMIREGVRFLVYEDLIGYARQNNSGFANLFGIPGVEVMTVYVGPKPPKGPKGWLVNDA